MDDFDSDDPPADLPPDLRDAVNAACDRFEDAVRTDPATRVEDHLDGPSDAADVLLRELLLLECEYRLRRGEAVTPDELDARFPGRSGLTAAVLARARRNATPTETALLFPDGSPAVIGRYRLVRELGRGGFGVVFQAVRLDDETDAAVKVPHAAVLFNPGLRDRFLREARTAAALDHPHVVRVIEAGDAGPVCYLAAEFVPGPTLAAWLDDRGGQPVPTGEAVALTLKLAAAVQHAHDRGVLHCDLTPANVLLAAGSLESPKLTDFGLARLAHATDDLSQTGQLIGTPAYMAPEQAGADRGAITARTDVYGLGAVLYHLLTGRPPVVAGSLAEALDRVVRGHPPRPRALNRDVPRNLEAVCLACLRKNPAARYPTAADFADDLRKVADGRPTVSRPLGVVGAVAHWARRNSKSAAWGGGVFTLAVLGLGLLLWHTSSLRTVHREAAAVVADRDRAGEALRVERDLARAREQAVRRRSYPDEIRRAHALLARHDLGGFRRVMDGLTPGPDGDELRGFEWHYLDALARPDPHRVLRSGSESVYAAAWAPDGHLVAVGTGKLLHLIDPRTGDDRHPPYPHPADVNRVVFAADGRWVATACDDGIIRVWRVGEAAPVELRGHEGPVVGLAFAPDGRVVSGGNDRTVRVWDPTCPKPGGRVVTRTATPVRCVACSPDGRFVATGQNEGDGGSVKLWNLATGGRVAEFRDYLRSEAGVAWVTDKRVMAAGRDGSLRFYDGSPAADGLRWTRTAQFGTEHGRVFDLDLSPNRASAAVARDGAVEVWHVPTARRADILRGHAGRVWVAAVSPDGRAVLSGGVDGTARVWNLTAARALGRTQVRGTANWMALDHAGRQLAVGTAGPIHIFDLPGDLSKAAKRLDPVHPVHAGGFAPTGELLLVANETSVYRIDPAVGTFRRVGRVGPIGTWLSREHLAVSPDGRWAAGWNPPEVRVCGPGGDGYPVIRAGGTHGPFVMGPGGRVVVACADPVVRVWDAETGRQTAALRSEPYYPRVVAISPDGRRVAAGCEKAVLVWDVTEATPLARWVGHRGPVRAVTFSPDGNTVAAADEDGTVRLWRVDLGAEVMAFDDHSGPVDLVAFSPDGRRLASAGPSARVPGETEVIVRDSGRPAP